MLNDLILVEKFILRDLRSKNFMLPGLTVENYKYTLETKFI